MTDRAGLWERVWFSPQRPETLVFVRWIVFMTVAVDVWTGRASFRTIPERPSGIWEPISLLAALRVPQPAPWVIEVLLAAALVGSAMTLVRVWPRVTGLVAAGAYLGLLLAHQSFGKIDHAHQPLVIMAVVLACAPIPKRPGSLDWRWRWPVQLCRAAMGVMLAAAAVSKLWAGGLEWVFSENMRNILVVQAGVERVPVLQDVALWIAAEPWRWMAAAAGAVIGEAALVFSIFVRSRLRVLFVLAGIGTVAGITLLIGLIGFPIVVLGAIFASPERAVASFHAGRTAVRAAGPPLLGMAALAAVILADSGKAALTLPLVAGAAVLVASIRRTDPEGPIEETTVTHPGALVGRQTTKASPLA